ncbi:hypothetical protein DTL42_18405 [Bremerella cremea]|uniref:Uncharacterized protein n=1 Tax=Bremerella cremea TaxID=1031537 RepID=A0A368KMQ2_9BACT|nr:hypothetical protein [Bremerella cremea]RCS43959.1 hypothetical protein DTL42_18405 [Bremerella cremea]
MSSLTLGGLIMLIAGLIWKLMPNRTTPPNLPLPPVELKEALPGTTEANSAPTRSEAFAAWLKIEQAMRAQNATPEQIRAAGLACLTPLIVEKPRDEK